jgi:hypothetical protein
MSNYLIEQHPLDFGSDGHLRAILEGYGLKRLTTQVGTTLLAILEHGRAVTQRAEMK